MSRHTIYVYYLWTYTQILGHRLLVIFQRNQMIHGCPELWHYEGWIDILLSSLIGIWRTETFSKHKSACILRDPWEIGLSFFVLFIGSIPLISRTSFHLDDATVLPDIRLALNQQPILTSPSLGWIGKSISRYSHVARIFDGDPSRYYTASTFLNCSDRTGAGAVNAIPRLAPKSDCNPHEECLDIVYGKDWSSS